MKLPSAIESLESRIAPSIVFGLRSTNELITFDSDAPTQILTTKSLTGLGDTLISIDVRPETGELYGLGSTSLLYTINPKTGVAVQVGSNGGFTLSGTSFGFDFNPVADLICVTSDTGQNIRINPDTGVLVSADTSIAYAAGDSHFGGSASVVGIAYTNSYPGAAGTTLYDIDYAQDALAIQNPPNSGLLSTVGDLGLNATNKTGFDIAAGSTTGLAAMDEAGGPSALYSINLTTGAAQLIGNIGDGSLVADIAIASGNLKLINATTATFRDVDGDTVKVKLSKGTIDPADFTLTPLGPLGGAQLETLNLSDAGFAGTHIMITVAKASMGDGQVNIGRINAGTNDIGKVSVPGDLGSLDAGSGTGTAVKSLSVRSMGSYGVSTHGNTGLLESDIKGKLGSLSVTADIHEAFISVTGAIGPITIGGSLIGGSASHSGAINNGGDIGAVRIGHDALGGAGNFSGGIASNGKIESVTIGGSLIGGVGGDSGKISSFGDIGMIKIAHDLQGGMAGQSGYIGCGASLTGVKLGGSLIGGGGGRSGAILVLGNMGLLKIGHDVQGGAVFDSGSVVCLGGTLETAIVGGSLIGGAGDRTGEISSGFQIGTVKIGHDIRGGAGMDSGSIKSVGNLLGVTIGGSLIGGAGNNSGEVFCIYDMGAVKVGYDVRGGAGNFSGRISGTQLASVTIGGSLFGGAQDGGGGNDTGEIVSFGDMGIIKIKGDVVGASVRGMEAADRSAYIESGGRIASIKVSGSIISGIDASTSGPGLTNNTSIRAHHDIGSLTVDGDIVGNETQAVFITARGQATPSTTTDTAIGAITVTGRVEDARIRAGYDTDLSPSNGNASVGAVKVNGDWIASILSAGTKPGTDGVFGTADDEVIDSATDAVIAKIASIKIIGALVGTDATVSDSDHFGFVAQQIGSFKSLGFTVHLTSATDPAAELSLTTADVTIREI